MASGNWSTFKIREVKLLELRQLAKRLKIGVAVFATLMAALVIAAVVLVIAFAQPWGCALILVAIPCFLGFVHCVLRGYTEVWPGLKAVVDGQKFYYSVLKRLEWRETNKQYFAPDWEVLDHWEGQKHYYALRERDREDLSGLEWENPFERKDEKS